MYMSKSLAYQVSVNLPSVITCVLIWMPICFSQPLMNGASLISCGWLVSR